MSDPLSPMEATKVATDASNKAGIDILYAKKRIHLSLNDESSGRNAELTSRRISGDCTHRIAAAYHALANQSHQHQADAFSATAKELEQSGFPSGPNAAPVYLELAQSQQVAADAHKVAFAVRASAALAEIREDEDVKGYLGVL